MAQIKQLKTRIMSLQINLSERQKQLDQYKSIQTQADKKIKAMQKIHGQKIKSLLNSLQILKKQKASIQGLSKQHKRSKLIQQLNKQILDQDIAIEAVRKYVYKTQGKQNGRKHLDQEIIKALTKGPDRIRPLTREQLRMEIEKLKQINIMLQRKIKQNSGNKKKNQTGSGTNVQQQDDSLSRVSSVMTQDSFIQNHQSSGQQILQKLRSLQLQVQTLNLESNSKTKIIQKLKTKVNQSQKLQSDYQLLKNQLQISNRKLYTFQKLLKQNKQTTNKKLIDLYERELKVQQLQMMSKQDSDKLKSLSANHNILLQQIQLQKEQLQTKYDQLKQQNQRLIFENITKKKTFDEIKQINNKQKSHLGKQLQKYQQQATRIMKQNQLLKQGNHKLQTILFQQRAKWVEDKQKFIQQIQQLKLNKLQSDKVDKLMVQIDQLKDQNFRLQKLFQEGNMAGTGNDKMLLQRLDNYKRKLEYYQAKAKNDPNAKSLQADGYNQMFEKYNKLLQEFQQYKRNAAIGNIQSKDGKTKKPVRKNVVQMTRKQKYAYDNYSSGVDSLVLQDVDSQILDNFNTSYEFSIHVNEFGQQIKMPKISQADKQLLKLISSDLWYFVKDDKLTQKIDQASLLMDSQLMDDQKNYMKSEQLRKIRNLSHPRGHKVTMHENQIDKLEQMSDQVSITSAMQKQLDAYDSDVNIQMKKNGPKFQKKKFLQASDLHSSIQSGEFKKKKKVTQKASKIKIGTKGSIHSSDFESNIGLEDMIDSDVSSVNLAERQLNRIDSDVETDFRKKRK